MTRPAMLTALLLPLILACRPAIAASPGTATCRPGDTYGVNLLAYVTEIATAGEYDSGAARRAYGLQITPPESVALISDEALCQRGAIALRDAMSGNLHGRPIRVYVVRAGNVYVVTDPEHRIGSRTARITVALDSGLTRKD
ncbi:MAG: hypothetical protein ACR2G6_09850 [Gemmatimonadaceae bacterium]